MRRPIRKSLGDGHYSSGGCQASSIAAMDTTLKLAALKHGFEVKREEEEDMKSTLVMPAEFDLKRGKIVSAQAWVKYLHLRIAQQSLAHRLPPMSQLAFECTVIEGVMDDIWDQLQGLIRDPFLTDAQHAELTRRLPFVIADIIIRFFVAFVRKSNESVANKVFSAKGLLLSSTDLPEPILAHDLQ
jgi:hypothetical protein